MSRLRTCGLVAALIALATARAAQAELPPELPLERLRRDRPRLFVNSASLPAVTRHARRNHKDLLDSGRTALLGIAATNLATDADYGVEAAATAFLYLCDRRPEEFEAAQRRLEASVRFYRASDRAGRVVNWYAASRIHACMAYDWLYESMDPAARRRIGRDLLDHVAAAQPGSGHSAPGDNYGDFRSGYYGTPSLLWYAGLATAGTGIDEAASERLLRQGYAEHLRLLRWRRECAGDDGGAAPTLGYALRAYPWAEFNFLHTLRSAFELDAAREWPHAALLPNVALWNRLPGGFEFGAGDSFHTRNEFPDESLFAHLAQIRHFYGGTQPEWAALAGWLQGPCAPRDYPGWPLTPLFLTGLDSAPRPRPPPRGLPKARHFEGLGQVILRSGWEEDATCALFSVGGASAHQKHFDENSFVIFHRGFLALDSGTRPEAGAHLYQYFCRTVAHNAVTLRMPGESFPPYWGQPAPGEAPGPVPNDGGMFRATGGVLRAFRTTPDYTYVAGDATACYAPAKCALALRQFLHVQPDVFVVCDRVVSTSAAYPKTWLLHTAREPRVAGDTFEAEHGDGRLWGRSLLPRPAAVRAVGGPGREFWSDGRNWPLPGAPGDRHALQPTETMGAWRVEVAAPAAESTVFLHVLVAGDRSVPLTPEARLVPGAPHEAALEFAHGGTRGTVRFALEGEARAELRLQRGATLIVASLTNGVQPQAGLALAPPPPSRLRRLFRGGGTL